MKTLDLKIEGMESKIETRDEREMRKTWRGNSRIREVHGNKVEEEIKCKLCGQPKICVKEQTYFLTSNIVKRLEQQSDCLKAKI